MSASHSPGAEIFFRLRSIPERRLSAGYSDDDRGVEPGPVPRPPPGTSARPGWRPCNPAQNRQKNLIPPAPLPILTRGGHAKGRIKRGGRSWAPLRITTACSDRLPSCLTNDRRGRKEGGAPSPAKKWASWTETLALSLPELRVARPRGPFHVITQRRYPANPTVWPAPSFTARCEDERER